MSPNQSERFAVSTSYANYAVAGAYAPKGYKSFNDKFSNYMAYSFVNIGWQLTALGDSSYYIVGFTQ